MAGTTRGARASTADRDRAVDFINTGYASGELDERMRDVRVGQALRARTLAQLRKVTGDLQAVPRGAFDPPAVPPTEPAAEAAGGMSKRELWLRSLITVAVFGVAGLAVLVVVDAVNHRGWESDPVLTHEGMRTFVADYEEKFPGTDPYAVVLYTTGADVEVPAGGDGLVRHYDYRNGEFTGGTGSTTRPSVKPVALGSLDIDAMLSNVARARRELGASERTVVTVAHNSTRSSYAGRAADWDAAPLPGQDAGAAAYAGVPAHVEIVVSDEFHRTGALVTNLAGDRVLAEVRIGEKWPEEQ